MKKLAMCALAVMLLASCSKKVAISKVDEPFDSFYDQFHKDLDFQLTRVQFPLEGELVSLDGGEPWTKEDWEPHVQKVTDISDPDYDTEIIKTDTLVTDKVWLADSGFSVERRFKKVNGRWYLVYYQTVNL